MQYDPIDYENIQRRVVARVQRRYRFFLHTAIFVLAIPFIGGWGSAFGFLIWISVWVAHFVWMSYQNNIERAIETEIDLERERVVKRKRHQAEMETHYQNHYPDDDESEWLYDNAQDYNYEEDY